MNYGIVSEKDDKTSLDFMKSKKVDVTSMYPSYNLNPLVSRMTCGDVIYVISVDRFQSVSRFTAFIDRVLKAGGTLRIMNQPYLEVGNGKHWRPSVQRHMDTLVALEGANVNRLLGTFKLTDAGKDFVARCIADITVGILAETYVSWGYRFYGTCRL